MQSKKHDNIMQCCNNISLCVILLLIKVNHLTLHPLRTTSKRVTLNHYHILVVSNRVNLQMFNHNYVTLNLECSTSKDTMILSLIVLVWINLLKVKPSLALSRDLRKAHIAHTKTAPYCNIATNLVQSHCDMFIFEAL